ncbi:MAG TPA: hypothetical protein VFU63_11995, partial [Ktedonobacterales bacterium]|nr:hypothetical protein [Ktedonobacterales bacterium]
MCHHPTAGVVALLRQCDVARHFGGFAEPKVYLGFASAILRETGRVQRLVELHAGGGEVLPGNVYLSQIPHYDPFIALVTHLANQTEASANAPSGPDKVTRFAVEEGHLRENERL